MRPPKTTAGEKTPIITGNFGYHILFTSSEGGVLVKTMHIWNILLLFLALQFLLIVIYLLDPGQAWELFLYSADTSMRAVVGNLNSLLLLSSII